MPTGTIYVPVSGTGDAPQDYTVPGAAVIGLDAVQADFDGSGAGAFLPAVQILDSSGHVMATVVGEQVAAGGSATVTFAPFLKQATSGAKPDDDALIIGAMDSANVVVLAPSTHQALTFTNFGSTQPWFTFTLSGGDALGLVVPGDAATRYYFFQLEVYWRRQDFAPGDPTLVRAYIHHAGGGRLFGTGTAKAETGIELVSTVEGLFANGPLADTFTVNAYNDDPANSYRMLGASMQAVRFPGTY